MLELITLCVLSAVAGGLIISAVERPPDPPEIDKAEIADYFRAIAALEERSEAERIFSVQDIIRGLYEVERGAECIRRGEVWDIHARGSE